jgi:hypothetical protein
MGAAGQARAREFSWERVAGKVDDYYGFVIRRLAAAGALPPDFRSAVPPSPRSTIAPPESIDGGGALVRPVGLAVSDPGR